MSSKQITLESDTSLASGLWRRRSSLLTLAAGTLILALSAYSGWIANGDAGEVDWLELSIYLCAVVVVATQADRLLRACAALSNRPAQWLRSRLGGSDAP